MGKLFLKRLFNKAYSGNFSIIQISNEKFHHNLHVEKIASSLAIYAETKSLLIDYLKHKNHADFVLLLNDYC